MIDFDKFCKEVSICSVTGYVIGVSGGEFEEIISRLRQAEKDAMRYRRLRDASGASDPDDFDKAVDEGIQ